jgi:hypothetical protein
MRPATVRAALRLALLVPWQDVDAAGRAAVVPQMAGDPWVRDYDACHTVLARDPGSLRAGPPRRRSGSVS